MKFRFLILLAVIPLFVLISLPAATADTITFQAGDRLVLTAYNSSDSAGIITFLVNHINNTTDLFDTFCIQDNVDINPGVTYYVGKVSNTVGYLGPKPSDPSPDGGWGILDFRVDYLFSKFASGAYNSYFNDPTYGQSYQADFQNLLWSFQGTGAIDYTSNYPNAQWNLDLSSASPGQTYQTVVLNLTTGFDYENWVGTGSDVQNMLADPPASVPEPSTLLLLGSGLTALGWAIRRRK